LSYTERVKRLANSTVRRLALRRQFPDELPEGAAGVNALVERLGYLQLDTIRVVGRAQHFVLWSRLPGYERRHLREAAYDAGALFEYYGHAAGYLPLSDYRYYVPAMRSFPWDCWWKRQTAELRPVMERVRARIEREGPLASRDFKEPPQESSGGWGSWKAAKYALTHLWLSGELMIANRDGFQRVFELTERVLPNDVDRQPPADGELGRFLIRRALGGLGAATERDLHWYLTVYRTRPLPLNELVAAGEIVEFEVDGAVHYTRPEFLDELPPEPPAPRLRIVNPFDGLVINRQRLERLFGFRYALECYKKADQREFGYYTLPLLRGERFVGRLDAKAERKRKALVLRGLWWEEDAPDTAELRDELAVELEKLARFNDCTRIEDRHA
jgi:hypothetical protein